MIKDYREVNGTIHNYFHVHRCRVLFVPFSFFFTYVDQSDRTGWMCPDNGRQGVSEEVGCGPPR